MATDPRLDELPVEVFNNILSFLVYPRSRLPGLTELQSQHDYDLADKRIAKDEYHLNPTVIPDRDRFGANLFARRRLCHPFNELASTSRRLRQLVEDYCKHLVKLDNRFNLPLADSGRRHPDLSFIVFRRLWLQYAPRYCIFCNLLMSQYPHVGMLNRPILRCVDCMHSQSYTLFEVECNLHLSRLDLNHFGVSGTRRWVLRLDIDELAQHLYGSKAHHQKPNYDPGVLCQTCVKFGTIARLARLREEKVSQQWDGDVIVTRKPDRNGVIRPAPDWVALERVHTDEWMYGEDELDCEYMLKFQWS